MDNFERNAEIPKTPKTSSNLTFHFLFLKLKRYLGSTALHPIDLDSLFRPFFSQHPQKSIWKGTYICGVGLVGSCAATAPRKSRWSVEWCAWCAELPVLPPGEGGTTPGEMSAAAWEDGPGVPEGPAASPAPPSCSSFFGESASHISVDNLWI